MYFTVRPLGCVISPVNAAFGYVGTSSITTRRDEAGAAHLLPAACTGRSVSRAPEARPEDAHLHVPSSHPKQDGIPVEGTFQSRETLSTKDWLFQGLNAESFCISVLELRWSGKWEGEGQAWGTPQKGEPSRCW